MNITLDDLNENQRQAVEWKDGRLLVLAGPGSGKTA
ncbi:UvrD-helicase domain-containing protein, partial [Thiolapillus sp.]